MFLVFVWRVLPNKVDFLGRDCVVFNIKLHWVLFGMFVGIESMYFVFGILFTYLCFV